MGNCANACTGKDKGSKKKLLKLKAPPEVPEINKITGEEPNPNQNREPAQQEPAQNQEKVNLFTDIEVEKEQSQKELKSIPFEDKENPYYFVDENFEGEYVDVEKEDPRIENGKPPFITPYIIPVSAILSNLPGLRAKYNLQANEEKVLKTERKVKDEILNGLKSFEEGFKKSHQALINRIEELDIESWVAEGSNIAQFRNIIPQQQKAFEAWKNDPMNEDLLENFASYSLALMEKSKTLEFNENKVKSFEAKVEIEGKVDEMKVFFKDVAEDVMKDIRKSISNAMAGIDENPNLVLNIDSLRLLSKSIYNLKGYNNTHFSTILLPKENIIVSGWSQREKNGNRLFFQTHSATDLSLKQEIELEEKYQNQDSLRMAFHNLKNELWVTQSSLPYVYKYTLDPNKNFRQIEKMKIPEEIGGLDSLFFVPDFGFVFGNSVQKGLIWFDENARTFKSFGAKANTYLRISKELLLIGCYKELLAYNLEHEKLIFREEIHDDYINSLSYFNDYHILLSGGWDNFIKKHSLIIEENGGIILKFKDSFRPTGNTVFTMTPINQEEAIFSSRDNNLYLYNHVTESKLRKKFPLDAEITSFVIDKKRATIFAKVGFNQIVMIN